jgi:hypothetical protein
MIVQNYTLKAANGKHIRIATKVILPNGEEIKFTEKMSKKEALRNVEYELKRRQGAQ